MENKGLFEKELRKECLYYRVGPIYFLKHLIYFNQVKEDLLFSLEQYFIRISKFYDFFFTITITITFFFIEVFRPMAHIQSLTSIENPYKIFLRFDSTKLCHVLTARQIPSCENILEKENEC